MSIPVDKTLELHEEVRESYDRLTDEAAILDGRIQLLRQSASLLRRRQVVLDRHREAWVAKLRFADSFDKSLLSEWRDVLDGANKKRLRVEEAAERLERACERLSRAKKDVTKSFDGINEDCRSIVNADRSRVRRLHSMMQETLELEATYAAAKKDKRLIPNGQPIEFRKRRNPVQVLANASAQLGNKISGFARLLRGRTVSVGSSGPGDNEGSDGSDDDGQAGDASRGRGALIGAGGGAGGGAGARAGAGGRAGGGRHSGEVALDMNVPLLDHADGAFEEDGEEDDVEYLPTENHVPLVVTVIGSIALNVLLSIVLIMMIK